MAEEGKLYFKGVRLGYMYEDELHGVLSKYVTKKVEAAGGELLELTPESQVRCTHVLASHCKQELARWAEQRGKAVVTLLWLHDCLNSNNLLPSDSEPLYSGKIEWRPQSSRGLCAAMTGYSDFIKHVYARMIEGLGVIFTKSMEPSRTDYLIAVDVSDETSKKIVAARRAPNTIHVVNVLWLYDSVRQGSILPSEAAQLAGPYEGNPPAGMDPAKRAPAISARPQVIANSDSEGPSDTAHEPASRAAGVEQRTLAQPSSAAAIVAGVSLLQPEPVTALPGTEISSATRKARHDQCKSKARPCAAASKDRAQEAAAAGPAAGPGDGEGAALHPSPAVEAWAPCRPAASLGSYRDMSQQVAHAEQAVTMLVNQLIPVDLEAPRAKLGRDAPPAKAPGGRDENASPELPSGWRGDGDRVTLRGSTEAPDHCPFWNASGDKASKSKGENGVLEESRPAPQQPSWHVPVNGEAPLASQPTEEEDLGAVSVGAEHPAADRATPKQEGRNGLLWKAAPLKRAEHGKVLKRKRCTEELVGRLVKKEFKEGVFKGRVTSFDGETMYYRVEYDDDDSEDLSLSELEPVLLPSSGGLAADGPAAESLGKRARVDGSKPAAEERPQERSTEAPPPPSSRATRKPLPRKRLCQNAGGSSSAANRERGDSPTENQRTSKPVPRKKQDLPRSEGPTEERGAGIGSASKRSLQDRRPVVTVSGMHTEQREQAAAMLKSLGVGFSSSILSHKWDLRCTHVVLDKGWKRGAKVLSAMAAGAWLLSEKYLEACSAARTLLEEDDFEVAGKRSNISSGAPKHWRMRRKLLDKAAFSGLKAVVYGEFEEGQKPCKEEVLSILQAGGATMLTVNQALHVGAHLVVTKPSRPATDAKIKQLVDAGLCIVSPTFVLDWVAHPWKVPSKEQVLFQTRMGADLTRATRERGGLPEGQGGGAGSGAWRAEEEAAETNGDVSQAY